MLLLAYIDAGSGTMLLQMILAGVVAVPFFFRRAIGEGLRRIRGDRNTAEKADAGEDVTADR